MSVTLSDLRFGIAGAIMAGLGRREEGNLIVKDSRVALAASPCHTVGSIFELRVQLKVFHSVSR